MLAGDGRKYSEDYLRRRAGRAAIWFVREYLGWRGALREPFDPEGDVILFDGTTVDVKCVPDYGYWITGHANHRPHALAVIIEVRGTWPTERFTHIGTVRQEQWRFERPGFRGAEVCWTVRKAEMGAPIPQPDGKARPFQIVAFVPEEIQTPESTSLGDDPTVPREMTQAELKTKSNREASKRRYWRFKQAPEGLFYPDDAPRGLGNGGGGKPPVSHDD